MTDRRPNILMIVTDQQRADTIGALGNDAIRTPQLDRLAREGTSFRRAYTCCPVCGPTRHALSTGIPPHVGLMTDNFGGPKMDVPDFAAMLHDAGYQTAGYGKPYEAFGRPKTHTPPGVPSSLDAFDEFLTTNEDYKPWFAEQGIDWVGEARGAGTEYYYIPMLLPYPDKYDRTHWTADRSVEFLRRRDRDRPFLLCTHFGRPHPSWQVPYPWFYLYRANQMEPPLRPANYRDYQCRANRFQNRYKWMEEACDGDDMLLRRIRAAYYAAISYVDFHVGRILEALGDEIEDTLVIFTCDHGEMLGDYGCVGKRCMLEAAVRVPLIARLPGYVPEGRECRGAASSLDIMPTVLEAAGLDCPELAEGRSLREVADLEAGERIVFSQFSRSWNGQYFAADGERCYWHSAADKREWHFAVGDEVAQGPILEQDERSRQLRAALIERHRDDVYSDAVQGDDWKDHDVPANRQHSHPDYGLLFVEDAEKIQADIDALGPGYSRKVTGLARGHLMGEHMVVPTEEEWEEMGYKAPWL
ncbi:MAG: sulfatase-like hydrolase/transferase [Candidatus Brocadiia bacterium]